MAKLKKRNFLHNHPIQERLLGIDNKHVMVDKEDWEMVLRVVRRKKEVTHVQ